MVIFKNRFAALEHDTDLNLLKVTYGNLRGIRLPDVAEFMSRVGECAVAHGVKRLLLDSSRSLNPMPEGEVEAAFRHVAETCRACGMERVARVGSPSLVSELKVREGIDRAVRREPFRFVLRTFSIKAEAMGWLARSGPADLCRSEKEESITPCMPKMGHSPESGPI